MIVETRYGNLVKFTKNLFYSDSIDSKLQLVAHGCNTRKTMGAGIALQFAKEIPEVYQADLSVTPKGGLFSIAFGYNAHVLNLYTQDNLGACARLDYIRECFENVNNIFVEKSTLYNRLHIPSIGCGIGGLKLEEVIKVINEVTPDAPIVHWIYN